MGSGLLPRRKGSTLGRSTARYHIEPLERRLLLSTVQATAQVYNLSNAEAPFVVTGNNGPAVFDGVNTNIDANDNFSTANWTTGQVFVGNIGSIQFTSTVIE